MTTSLIYGGCFLCCTETSLVCQNCDKVFYCCADHLELHCPKDSNCFPYEVVMDPEKGRILVATRDIHPGDLIFREIPLTLGNLHETPPVCLTCWSLVDFSYECDECHLPMCSPDCASDPIHKDNECTVFRSQGGDILKSASCDGPHPFYQCITPLRCLMLKEKSPEKWNALKEMMDHLDDKPRDIFWDMNQHNIVKYLRNVPQIQDKYSELEINHVIGALEVNAFEMTSHKGGRGRGVFPLISLMSHSCISNARYLINNDGFSEVRANTIISSGEEITDHYVTPLNGTMYRRTHLRDGWFFSCRCSRCQDKTEGGTYSSAFKDFKGCGGNVLPCDPLDFNSKWSCEECGKKYSWCEDLEPLEEELTKILDADGEDDVKYNGKALTNLLDKYQFAFHPSHYLIIAIKRYLIYTISPDSETAKLTLKLKLCSEILQVYDVICPGCTKERGLTLFELFSCRRRDPGFDSVAVLNEVIQCLSHEKPDTFEFMILNAAKMNLKKIIDKK